MLQAIGLALLGVVIGGCVAAPKHQLACGEPLPGYSAADCYCKSVPNPDNKPSFDPLGKPVMPPAVVQRVACVNHSP
jgi:hypothetical protein